MAQIAGVDQYGVASPWWERWLSDPGNRRHLGR